MSIITNILALEKSYECHFTKKHEGYKVYVVGKS